MPIYGGEGILNHKLFKKIMAIVALVLVAVFTVGWIIYLSVPAAQNVGVVTLLLFCGGFGVLMFIGIKLYNPRGIDGPPTKEAEENKVEEQKTEDKTNNE